MMKPLDFLPLAGFAPFMIWVMTVWVRCHNRLWAGYQREHRQIPWENGVSWQLFDPAPGDSQEILELKAELRAEARRKTGPLIIVCPVVMLILIGIAAGR